MSLIPNDFVLVTGSHAVSPHMKVSARLGRFNLEMNGVQEVDVEHDPLLVENRLLMSETESPYYILPLVEPREPRLIPFFSRQRTRLEHFGFLPSAEGRSLIYSAPAYDRGSAQLKAMALSRKLNITVRGAFGLLHHILSTIGKLTDWPLEVGLRGEWDRIEVRMGKSFVDTVADETGMTFPEVSERECLIAVLNIPR
jgi:hypothetical protein